MAGEDVKEPSDFKQERLLEEPEGEGSLIAMRQANITKGDGSLPTWSSTNDPSHPKVKLGNFASIAGQPDDLSAVSENKEEEPSESDNRKCKILYILLFAFIGLNDGMVIGYKSSLTGIFTEQKVPSEERSLLSLITVVYAMRMVFAPLADKYFLPFLGKRRTYLLPCKLFSAFVYMVTSAYINHWVKDGKVLIITLYFLFVNTVMILENNSLQGYRLDFFGRKNSGSAGASQTIGLYVGLAIGLQLFTCLNSDYITKEYLGLSGVILSHTTFFRIISLINLAAIPIIFIIPEKNLANLDPEEEEQRQKTSVAPWNVIKALYRSPLVWKAMLWNFIGPNLVLGMKVTVGQFYIQKHFRREEYVMIMAMVMIPVTVISNIVWIRIVKTGNLMFKLWLTILNGVVVESLHAINYHFFDPKVNYRRTAISLGLIISLDCLANWMMIQQSFFLSTTSKKYTVTYLQTTNSLFSVCRVLPISGMQALVDYIRMEYFFGICVFLQIAYNWATLDTVKFIDQQNPTEFADQFERELEGRPPSDSVADASKRADTDLSDEEVRMRK